MHKSSLTTGPAPNRFCKCVAHAALLSTLLVTAAAVAQAPETSPAQSTNTVESTDAPPAASAPNAQPPSPAAPAQAAAVPATPAQAEPTNVPPADTATDAVPAPMPTLDAPVASASPPPSTPEATITFRATPGAATRRPTLATEPEPTIADHDSRSLYLRMAAGVGFPFGTDVTDAYAIRGNDELRFSGYSFAVDLMAGSAVLPWLMLGGGVASDSVVGGTVRDLGKSERSLERGLYYAVLGGFADIYTSPPAGLHFQALLGLARLSPSYNLGLNTALGFGAVLGAGYELRAGRRWNVGLLARIAISPLSMDAVGGHKPSPSLYEPSILWTATFRPEAE
jgi:hypothetical protein